MFIYYPVDVMGLYHKLESDVEVFVVKKLVIDKEM